MIIPSDKHLNDSVEFFDSQKESLYLSRTFWQNFFPSFLRDLQEDRNVTMTSEKKTRIARDVKHALFNYWHIKFQKGREPSISLYNAFMAIFDKYSNTPVIQYSTCAVDDNSEITDMGRTFVDELVDDFNHLDFDSQLEIETMADMDRYGEQYQLHQTNVDLIRNDYESGKFNRFKTPDSSLNSRVDFCYRVSEAYSVDGGCVGAVTVWNCLSVKDDVVTDLNKDFPLARFHAIHKQYGEFLIVRRLFKRIGYDLCQLIYERFIHDGVFSFTNVYEYALCSLFLFDICKRVTFRKNITSFRIGFINLSSLQSSFGSVYRDASTVSLGKRMLSYTEKDGDRKTFSGFTKSEIPAKGIDRVVPSKRDSTSSIFSQSSRPNSTFGWKQEKKDSIFSQK